MSGVLATGGMRLEVLSGTMPPRMAMVDGGRKSVVCSWRELIGMGARVCHVEMEYGRDCARLARERIARLMRIVELRSQIQSDCLWCEYCVVIVLR